MRRSIARRGKRRSHGATSVSLFPFLAVLICTVGAMVLLLVVISRQARVEASRMAAAERAEDEKRLEEDGEDVSWRIGHLRAALAATQEQLTEARLNLGHVEDHARQLRRELSRLEETVRQLDSAASDSAEQAALRRQIDEVAAKIDETKAKVERARRDAAGQSRSYAIIPYEGPHGTRRRPIYIECRADAIILHPEKIVFQPADFEGSPGPANPLAVALRAAREYMLEVGRFDPTKSGEPYPLLLVRPTGVHSYYAAREAMSSWESDFGYELIDEHWELRFDPPDPKLAQLLDLEIARARMHMEQLAKAAPRHYERVRGQVRGERAEYTVSSTTGVVVPYGGEPTDNRPRRQRWTGSATGSRSFNPDDGDRAGTGTSSGEETLAGTHAGMGADVGPDLGTRAGIGTGTGTSTLAGDGTATGNEANGTPFGQDAALNSGRYPTGTSGLYPGGDSRTDTVTASGFAPDAPHGAIESAASPSLGNPSGSGTSMASAPGTTSGGACSLNSNGQAQPSSGGSAAPSSASASANSTASAPQRGEWSNASSATSNGATQSPPRLGEWNPASSNDGTSAGSAASVAASSHRPPPSIAQRRGPDWALPEVASQATALTKPIRIECYPDRLVLVAERGLTGGRQIALAPRTADSMDEFVSAVWDYAEGWGLAGRGMYWRPLLHVYVAPGAEPRYHDLEALLRDSGLPIQWKI